MIINTNSWHYKLWCWTYTNNVVDKYPPLQTNLCSYVQRMFWIPLYWFLAYATTIILLLGLAVSIVGGLGYLEYLGWSHHFSSTLLIHASLILAIMCFFGYVFLHNTNNQTVELAKEWASAKKQGICPLIEFTNSNDTEIS